ncbi:MAG: NAD(P)-dependent oxidoreductase [Desulfobulbaceae bacterium]|nr:NAD(P)-dependent oxidoreductase [Desulfobulbaceae bacterium]
MDNKSKKVGFIGLGAMGFGMACNVVKSGFPTTIYDIDEEKIRALTDRGAMASESIALLARNSDVVITILPDEGAVEKVYLGQSGLVEAVKNGSILIDMGTTSTGLLDKISKQVENKGIKLLGAPVSGGAIGAEEATLTIMVGGDKDAFDKCQGILQTMGKKVVYAGPLGSATIVKLVNNLLLFVKCAAIAEGFVLGVKAGVSTDVLYDLITSSSGTDWALETIFSRYAFRGKFTPPSFALAGVLKDLGLARKMAKELDVSTVLADLSYELFEKAVDAGKGEMDFSAILSLLEEQAEVKVRFGDREESNSES